jgi:transposase InsO family protein
VPWNTQSPCPDQRAEFVTLILGRTCPFSAACERFGVSRKTGYKWLRRATAPQPQPLLDRSRRPRSCPHRTPADVERLILGVHDDLHWGARKIHAHLCQRQLTLPSARAVHGVLRRHGRVATPVPPAPPHRFERSVPNNLWQMDYKGPLAGAASPRYLLTVLDDHSRYLLALRLCPDQTMATAWAALWELLGEVGLPAAILSDNGFAPRGPSTHGLSWLEARLMRLGIGTPHGRPYHPQTQGKVERLHRSLEEEVLPWLDWALPDQAIAARLDHWRREVYNPLRPHEALGNAVPASRWYASARPRPAALPAVLYPEGVETRKVMYKGEICWRGYEMLVGAGLKGERVGVEVRGAEVVILYGQRELRRIAVADLEKGRCV